MLEKNVWNNSPHPSSLRTNGLLFRCNLIFERELVMKKYIIATCFSLLITSVIHGKAIHNIQTPNKNAQPSTEWTFVICMEPMDNLSRWGVENLGAMMQANPKIPVNILVQWHGIDTNLWRYSIKQNSMQQIGHEKRSGDIVTDITHFFKLAVNNYPALHYFLILWGHGFGALDPRWQEIEDKDHEHWVVDSDERPAVCTGNFCPINRGMFFNDDAKVYMHSSDIQRLGNIIHNDILTGKKLDILGTDCCKMAMIEVGYLVKDHVNFLIGAQNCELIDGWNYRDFFDRLQTQQTPASIAQLIIQTYGEYYQKHTQVGVYTQSACDLSLIDDLSHNVSTFSQIAKRAFYNNNTIIINAIHKARTLSAKICKAPYYTDIDSFYEALTNELDTVTQDQDIQELKLLLRNGRTVIKQLVIANTTGTAMTQAHGVSIYFPQHRIDHSYRKTLFAQETEWLSFLDLFVEQTH